MNKRRILLVTHEFPPHAGGVARFCFELAQALSKYADVDVVAPRYDQSESAPQDPTEAFKIYRFPGFGFRYRTFLTYRSAIQARLTNAYDLVIIADWPALLAMRSLDVGAARRMAIFYGSEIRGLAESPVAGYLLRSRAALAGLDDIVCISTFTRKLFLSYFPEFEPQARIVPLGVSDYWFAPVDDEQVRQFRTRYGCNGERKLLLTVARLDRRKGHDRLIQAIGSMPADSRDKLVYICIGPESEPDYVAELKLLAASNAVHCVFPGRLSDDEVRIAYRAADLFALTANADPVKHEGFGLVLLESAAQGLPAIVTDVDAIPEVVNNGVNGVVCTSNSMIAATLIRLVDGNLNLPGESCIAHARTYSWDRCACSILDLSE